MPNIPGTDDYIPANDPNWRPGLCQACGVKPIDKAWSRFYCKACDKKYGVKF